MFVLYVCVWTVKTQTSVLETVVDISSRQLRLETRADNIEQHVQRIQVQVLSLSVCHRRTGIFSRGLGSEPSLPEDYFVSVRQTAY